MLLRIEFHCLTFTVSRSCRPRFLWRCVRIDVAAYTELGASLSGGRRPLASGKSVLRLRRNSTTLTHTPTLRSFESLKIDVSCDCFQLVAGRIPARSKSCENMHARTQERKIEIKYEQLSIFSRDWMPFLFFSAFMN